MQKYSGNSASECLYGSLRQCGRRNERSNPSLTGGLYHLSIGLAAIGSGLGLGMAVGRDGGDGTSAGSSGTNSDCDDYWCRVY